MGPKLRVKSLVIIIIKSKRELSGFGYVVLVAGGIRSRCPFFSSPLLLRRRRRHRLVYPHLPLDLLQ